jgi:RNA polymerase sigma-70 factor, ECF subfamily
MSEADANRVTKLLIELGKGDERPLDEILPLVYDELRRLARGYMARERSDHTLQPTALLHEAYLRLVDQKKVDWRNRSQFFGLAANMMRRILANHARDRVAEKRGGGVERVTLSMAGGAFEQPGLDIIELDNALSKLAAMDERQSRVVEMKFFAGLTSEEIASALGISTATVEREWTFARTWLFNELRGTPAP